MQAALVWYILVVLDYIGPITFKDFNVKSCNKKDFSWDLITFLDCIWIILTVFSFFPEWWTRVDDPNQNCVGFAFGLRACKIAHHGETADCLG